MAIQQRSKPGAAATAAVQRSPAVARLGNGAAAHAPQSTVAKEAVTTVTTTMLENGTIKGEPVVAEEREIKVFATTPANVGIGLSFTRNLGNCEAVKTHVQVNMPCYNEEVDSAAAQVLDKVKSLLDTAMAELQIEGTAGEAGVGEGEAVPEADGTATEEEDSVTIEYLTSASRQEMAAICAASTDLGISADDYSDDDDLRQTMIQTIFGEEGLQEYLASTGGVVAEGDGASDDDKPLTEEELTAATPEELKQLFAQWELGPYPKGPPAAAKKAAIKKIITFQAEATAGQ
jgi:hypothetical protein